ncbi:MAG: sel1 repeat family protein [Rhodospirillales bacterium]|nr:sel1 repeat family protein [Rhodospirillales bacterium]
MKLDRSTVLIGIALTVIFLSALYIRYQDAGYVHYYLGQFDDARPHLQKKADSGEALAHYLLGMDILRFSPDPRYGEAGKWFLEGARRGSVDAAAMFIQVKYFELSAGSKNPKKQFCDLYFKILARSSLLGSLAGASNAGEAYEHSNCSEPNIEKSAKYYGIAQSIDRRMGSKIDHLVRKYGYRREASQRIVNWDNAPNSKQQFLTWFFDRIKDLGLIK